MVQLALTHLRVSKVEKNRLSLSSNWEALNPLKMFVDMIVIDYLNHLETIDGEGESDQVLLYNYDIVNLSVPLPIRFSYVHDFRSACVSLAIGQSMSYVN
jgi:hypothetical protein